MIDLLVLTFLHDHFLKLTLGQNDQKIGQKQNYDCSRFEPFCKNKLINVLKFGISFRFLLCYHSCRVLPMIEDIA